MMISFLLFYLLRGKICHGPAIARCRSLNTAFFRWTAKKDAAIRFGTKLERQPMAETRTLRRR
ncbi:hypothetical protein NHF53_12620 [Ciceribacter sp. RN22]|nr:hypothetical protein [Ciceribacter sp. RN22]